jgi:tetratricopeptide (TPR) repeat protein
VTGLRIKFVYQNKGGQIDERPPRFHQEEMGVQLKFKNTRQQKLKPVQSKDETSIRNLTSRGFSHFTGEKISNSFNPVSIILSGLIFFAIAPYSSADVWSEAVILTTIFIVGGTLIFSRNSSIDSETKQLLTPFLVLAGYSFFQGLLTLFVQNRVLDRSAFLPYSFDLTTSFWCALKFLAAAIFVKIISVDCRKHSRFLIWSLIFTGNFYAACGIFRYVIQANFPETFPTFILPQLRPGIGFGTFINQNHFAYLMLMNLGLNAGLCIYGGLKKQLRLLLFIFSLLTWTAIVLTASRGGIISSFVVIAVLILAPLAGIVRNERNLAETFSFGKRLTVFIVLLAALVFAVAFIGQDRVVQRFEEIPAQFEGATDLYGYQRVDVWRATTAMIGAHSFYGVGFGGFRYAVSQYIDISGASVPQQAHNDYLELAASGGVIAFFCSIWFLYKFFRTLKRRFSESSTSFTNAARIGAVGAICGITVHNFFDFGLQLAGNWLFLAAIVSVVVYRESGDELKQSSNFSTKFFGAILLLSLSIFSLWFGLSRLENRLAKNASDNVFAQNNSVKIPFDADVFETKAFINNKFGSFGAESENLQKAIEYRPTDYVLWLKSAKNQQVQNQTTAAENSFKEAIELAPFYGEPLFYYGIFLVANNRKSEGFEELCFAFRRNPQYFGEVLALVWRETNENADEMIKLLSPQNSFEREKIIEFLLDKKAYSIIAALGCRTEDLNDGQRNDLTIKLFEKRQFFYAHQISERDCNLSNSSAVNFADGDFETGDVREGFGFGWRGGDLPETVKIGFDDETKAIGRRSFGVSFNGNSDPAQPIISQIVSVGKRQKYRLSFAYRTEKIVSGGVPLLYLILKQPDGDVIFKEINLTTEQNDWRKVSTEIETLEQTEAIEIRLARRSCGQSLCPIFGRLWLDNFTINY